MMGRLSLMILLGVTAALAQEYLIYDTNTQGSSVSASAWQSRCSSFFANNAGVQLNDARLRMRIEMGNVVDHYRPVSGSNICQMLVSDNLHEFSPDGQSPWYKPTKHYNFHLGGSSDGWPRANIAGDDRRYLSFWGQGYGSRGCCHNEYTGPSAGAPAWGKHFKMYFYLAEPSTHTQTPLPTQAPGEDFLVYDTNTQGSSVSASAWQSRCSSFFANNAGVHLSDARLRMRIEMGNVVDHYRPVAGSNICQMLLSDNLHQFSPNGRPPWYTPTKHFNFHLGGSSDGWPRANIEGDDRRYLSFWGQGYGSRGCCHNEYTGTTTGTPAWGKHFKMYFYLAQSNAPSPVPTVALTPAPTFPPLAPGESKAPTPVPTVAPTPAPTLLTLAPGESKAPTPVPTVAPTPVPTTLPTQAPGESEAPTPAPTVSPTQALGESNAPTPVPTQAPTPAPTTLPTQAPGESEAPTPAPTVSPTQAPGAPQLQEYLVYDTSAQPNNVSSSAWQARCSSFFTNTADVQLNTPVRVRIEMGNVVDWFRPVAGSDVCQMLASDSLHEFSPNGSSPWVKPTKPYNTHLGGSSDNWPYNNVAGDDRRYLSFWGQGFGPNGCCHYEYTGTAARAPAWGKSFKMFFVYSQSAFGQVLQDGTFYEHSGAHQMNSLPNIALYTFLSMSIAACAK